MAIKWALSGLTGRTARNQTATLERWHVGPPICRTKRTAHQAQTCPNKHRPPRQGRKSGVRNIGTAARAESRRSPRRHGEPRKTAVRLVRHRSRVRTRAGSTESHRQLASTPRPPACQLQPAPPKTWHTGKLVRAAEHDGSEATRQRSSVANQALYHINMGISECTKRLVRHPSVLSDALGAASSRRASLPRW